MPDQTPAIRPGFKIAGVILIVLFAFAGSSALTKYFSSNGESEPQQVAQASLVAAASEAVPALASAPDASAARDTSNVLKPEMVVVLTKGAVVCASKDELYEMTMHAIEREATKANAMAGCKVVPPGNKVKIIAVEYNIDAELGVMEIVGPTSNSGEGVWAYTVGAEPVTAGKSKKK